MKVRGWSAYFLPQTFWDEHADRDLDWQFPEDLLLVVDYVASIANAVGSWLVDMGRRSTGRRMRVLLLERDGFEIGEPRWFRAMCEHQHPDDLRATLFDPTVPAIDLSAPMDLESMLRLVQSVPHDSVVHHGRSPQAVSDGDVGLRQPAVPESAARTICMHLGVVDPDHQRPLYLLFLARAWIEAPDDARWKRSWNLQDLLRTCYLRETTLVASELAEAGFRRGAVTAALDLWAFATATTSIHNVLAESNDYVTWELRFVPGDRLADFAEILCAHCGSDENDVEPFVPDIPGEYLVLERLNRYREAGARGVVERFLRGCWADPERGLLWMAYRAQLVSDYADIEGFRELLSEGQMLRDFSPEDDPEWANVPCAGPRLDGDRFVARLARAVTSEDMCQVLEDFERDLNRDVGADGTWQFLGLHAERIMSVLSGSRGSSHACAMWGEVILRSLSKQEQVGHRDLGRACVFLKPGDDVVGLRGVEWARFRMIRNLLAGVHMLMHEIDGDEVQIDSDEIEFGDAAPIIQAVVNYSSSFSNTEDSMWRIATCNLFIDFIWAPSQAADERMIGWRRAWTELGVQRMAADIVGFLEHQSSRRRIVEVCVAAITDAVGPDDPLAKMGAALLDWVTVNGEPAAASMTLPQDDAALVGSHASAHPDDD
jgi:hypothetical protein